MAITSRAARNTMTAVETTPAVVGPGAYLSTERPEVIHGYAPFGSTAERGQGGAASQSKAPMPGPGAYQVGGRALSSAGGAGAAFKSATKRMGAGKAAKDARAPGPGTYSVASSIGRGGAAASSAFAAPVAASAPPPVAWLRVPTAPSVPTHAQSYGYEETPTGELVLQPPPVSGYTGVSGALSAGPGSYDPTRATRLTKRHTGHASFGNSRVQRSVFSSSSETPGPGTYGGGAPGTAPTGASRGSAAFKSRVPMSHENAVDDEHQAPGPGSYSLRGSFGHAGVPEAMQCFGSTQNRMGSSGATPHERARLAQPGPGAYNNPISAFGDGGKPKRGKKGRAAEASLASFNTSELRFKEGRGAHALPGPGEYDVLDQNTFVAQLQRKTHGRNGVFGSTTRRFHALRKDAVPGAGTYDPQPAVDAGRTDGPTPEFASGVERFTRSAPSGGGGAVVAAKKDPVPPPWHYHVRTDNAWDRRGGRVEGRQNGVFGSSEVRFQSGSSIAAKAGATPGPGSYRPKDARDMRKQATTAESFGTKASRFVGGGGGGSLFGGESTPGPGHYESAIETTAPLVKRSFNITVGN